MARKRQVKTVEIEKLSLPARGVVLAALAALIQLRPGERTKAVAAISAYVDIWETRGEK